MNETLLQVKCQSCYESIEIPSTALNQTVECAYCHAMTPLQEDSAWTIPPIVPPPYIASVPNMNLTLCHDCRQPISIRATKCPHCGLRICYFSKSRTHYPFFSLVLFIMGLGFGFTALLSFWPCLLPSAVCFLLSAYCYNA